MNQNSSYEDELVERRVTYMLEMDGKVILVENVPARISLETGERFFSPDTVERLHTLVRSDRRPDRFIETPVLDFAA